MDGCLVYGSKYDAKQLDRLIVCLDINHRLYVHKGEKKKRSEKITLRLLLF